MHWLTVNQYIDLLEGPWGTWLKTENVIAVVDKAATLFGNKIV